MKTFFSVMLLTAVIALSAGNSFAGFIPIGGKTCTPDANTTCAQAGDSAAAEEPPAQIENAVVGETTAGVIFDGFARALDLMF